MQEENNLDTLEDESTPLEKEVIIVPVERLRLFPGITSQIDIDKDMEESINGIKFSLDNKSNILLIDINTLDSEKEVKNGLMAVVEKIIDNDEEIKVFLNTSQRAKVTDIITEDDLYKGKATIFDYSIDKSTEINETKVIVDMIIEAIENHDIEGFEIPEEVKNSLIDISGNPSKLADVLSSYLPLKDEEYDDILGEQVVLKRLYYVYELELRYLQELKIRTEIFKKVEMRFGEIQRENILRAQLSEIKKELNESEDTEEEYIKRINDLDIDEDSREKLIKEVKKLSTFSMGSPDLSITLNYLDTVLELPWNKKTEDIKDIKRSKEILDREHFGLKDVKERILEYIAVLNLKEDSKPATMCLVGPPGVGKTSIVKSIAESLGREFVSIKLGGITDESEIRGHRKTYVGAMPGRIISALTRVKTKNPVILLDELDKVGSDYRGDPSSALLEVLDPNQNYEFIDRYIEIPFDLSKVLFVTTANTAQNIPAPLQDRMEMIHLPGYNSIEKYQIAKRYLIKKQMEENGLSKDQINITDSVIKIIEKSYTREAGVRDLERNIGKIMRKSAKEIVETKKSKVNVSLKNYEKYLGREKFFDDTINKKPEIGSVTGLAWTQVGGVVLQIEVNKMEGKGNLQLTGSLGNVMKESAMAAFSYIKANKDKLKITEDLSNIDIHVHVPEGATPKDGPSAGITILTAMYSAICEKPVRNDIAMTGEITIRGKVLPIGGLKEKALAALRYNIKNVIIPKENERDLQEIEEYTKKELKFISVENALEVLKIRMV